MQQYAHTYAVFSQAWIEERHLGGASFHSKGFYSTPIPLQRKISTEGLCVCGGGRLFLKYAWVMSTATMYPHHYNIFTLHTHINCQHQRL